MHVDHLILRQRTLSQLEAFKRQRPTRLGRFEPVSQLPVHEADGRPKEDYQERRSTKTEVQGKVAHIAKLDLRERKRV
jgi:DNA anti-recombination protein RmuC